MAETVFSPRILPQVTPVNPNIIQGSVTQIKPLSLKELNDAKNDEEDRKLRRELMRDRENMQNERLEASQKAAEARAKDTWRNNQVRAMNDFMKNRSYYKDSDQVYIGYLPEEQREALLSVHEEGQQIILETMTADIDSWNPTETRNKFTDFSARVNANENYKKAAMSLGHLKSYTKAIDKLGGKAHQVAMAQQLDAFRDTGDVRVLIANDTNLDGAQADFTKYLEATIKSIKTTDSSEVDFYYQPVFKGVNAIMAEYSDSDETKQEIIEQLYNQVMASSQAATYFKRWGNIEDEDWGAQTQGKIKDQITSAVNVGLKTRIKHTGNVDDEERIALKQQAKTQANVNAMVDVNLREGLSPELQEMVGGDGFLLSKEKADLRKNEQLKSNVKNTETYLKKIGYSNEELAPIFQATFLGMKEAGPIDISERIEEGSIWIINDDTKEQFKNAVLPMKRYEKLASEIKTKLGDKYSHKVFADIFSGVYKKLAKNSERSTAMENIKVEKTDDYLVFKHEGKIIAKYDWKTNKFGSR